MPEHSRRGVYRRVAQAAFFCSFLSLDVPAAGFVAPSSFRSLAQNSVLRRSRGQHMMVATHMCQRDDTQCSRRGFVVGALLGHAVLASNPLLVYAKEADQEKKLKLVKSGSLVDVQPGGFTWRILS
jgi:hypothetical protein